MLISHTSKVMLKILPATLQQYTNQELSYRQTGFRKGRRTRDQIANFRWIIEKAREFQENIFFCFTEYAKTFDCMDHNKLWKILNEIGIPYLPVEKPVCRWRNNRTRHGTTDWFKIGNGEHQGHILSPCLFSFYAKYIMRNSRLDEAQAGNQDCQEK